MAISVEEARARMAAFRRGRPHIALSGFRDGIREMVVKATTVFMQPGGPRPAPGPLGIKSGKLKKSVKGRGWLSGASLKGFLSMGGPGVPYGPAHEYGVTTRPHVILPRRAAVLAFELGGRTVFSKKVNHPGSVIPARPVLRPSFEDVDLTEHILAPLRKTLKRLFPRG